MYYVVANRNDRPGPQSNNGGQSPPGAEKRRKMNNLEYTILFQYHRGTYPLPDDDFITGQHVAQKMHDIACGSNVRSWYFWANVPNDLMMQTVVVWKKTDGKSITPQDVYEMDDQEEIDFNLFCAGWHDNQYHPQIAAEEIYGGNRDSMEPGEWESCVADIEDRYHEIIRKGKFWISQIEGKTIPSLLLSEYKITAEKDEIADTHKLPDLMGTLYFKITDHCGNDADWSITAATLDDAVFEALDKASVDVSSLDSPFEDFDELLSYLWKNNRNVEIYWQGNLFHGKLRCE